VHRAILHFSVFSVPSVVNFELISRSNSFFPFPAAPFGSLMQGAPLGMLRLPLWCGGWQALFGSSCGLWVRSGDGCLGGWLQVGSSKLIFNFGLGELYLVVVCGVLPWLLKYINVRFKKPQRTQSAQSDFTFLCVLCALCG